MIALDWNTLVTGAIAAAINGTAMFLSMRYIGRVVDKLEGNGKEKE